MIRQEKKSKISYPEVFNFEKLDKSKILMQNFHSSFENVFYERHILFACIFSMICLFSTSAFDWWHLLLIHFTYKREIITR